MADSANAGGGVTPTPVVTQSVASGDEVAALVADSGGYELLKKRLATEGTALAEATQTLNEARLAEFGRSEQKLIARMRARTENNCVVRDVVRIGDAVLLGYNVFIGLRKETKVGDVFALYRLADREGVHELDVVPTAGTFLDDQRFVADFRELYAYYKQAALTQLRVNRDRLLAAFKIGEQVTDIRVFRWSIEADGTLKYIDNRGEREIALPPAHDFEWTPTTREDHVGGKFPHVDILGAVFVETVGGDLTIKIEDNTETGQGILHEPVDDKTQSLADAEIAYAKVGALILLRVRPYREPNARYFVYNTRTQLAQRIDAIGRSCVALPEDHGIIFPGGYHLQSGESKQFDLAEDLVATLRFKRLIRSPNGEDVLYVFYAPELGRYVLFTYNLIEKTLASPILSDGYARFHDGRILIMQVEDVEPTRAHPAQLWQTPFASDEHAAAQTPSTTFFGRIGNADLVRGVSELIAISRAVREQTPTRVAYEDLIRQCGRLQDAFPWLVAKEVNGLGDRVRRIAEVARVTLDEFDKVAAIRREAARSLREAEAAQHVLVTDLASLLWQSPEDFVRAFDRMRSQRGTLLALKEVRYIDVARIDAMDAAIAQEQTRIGERATTYLAEDRAFEVYRQALQKATIELQKAPTTREVNAVLDELDKAAQGLDLLTGELGGIAGGDATTRTKILEQVSKVYGDLNKLRAEARGKKRSLGNVEGAAEFGAQFKLFAQSVENALELADAPERCDESLTRLLAQLEDLEGRFGESDAFIADIAAKREAVYEAFSAKKQTLLEARQRRSRGVIEAATRILDGIPKRVTQLADLSQVHAYFASDPLIAKVRSLADELRRIDASVQADDLDTRLKTARDQAIRSIRDKQDLAVEGGAQIRFGRHVFTVARQALDLTLVPQGDALAYHLTGTEYFAPVADDRLAPLREYWSETLLSESATLYRGEYLAGCFIEAVAANELDLKWSGLVALRDPEAQGTGTLVESIRLFAAVRYQEGYQRGVHDADAARIVVAIVAMQEDAGLLRFGPAERALAMLYWVHDLDESGRASLTRQARSAAQVRELFATRGSLDRLIGVLNVALTATDARFAVLADDNGRSSRVRLASEYLVAQLASAKGSEGWAIAAAAADLAEAFTKHLERASRIIEWRETMEAADPVEAWQLARDWLRAFAEREVPDKLAWIDGATSQLVLDVPRVRVNATLDRPISGLLGEHATIKDSALSLNLNDFWARFHAHHSVFVPAFSRLAGLRQTLVGEEKSRLALAQFQAKPLSSFVRNKLIDELYLPLVADNLAKQIGTVGASNRSDRMGMLLLISPPGYGKTTLMEYVADRLGLIFVRINCPALGHGVTAIDPAQAPNSAARQELEKLNLGLAMSANVMLYLDDIQHTNPEFLQKFIALADGTRRIEGVWQGEARTYDMRGKRFAVVMAGNPYTESGDVFKIPDMLANRADIYNLGDVLSGREALFSLSYIENSLTSNPALAPLASRDPLDVPRLVRLAQGEEVASSEFAHSYSAPELSELTALLQRLFKVRDLLLKVNLQYIASAAQDDEYRTEPPFKLQGSYRNMAKLAAKVTAVMEPSELDALLRDHYRGEAQTLTMGAEENLLKLAELLGTQNATEQARWKTIKDGFVRAKKLGGSDSDAGGRIASTLYDIQRAIETIGAGEGANAPVVAGLKQLDATIKALRTQVVVNQAEPSALADLVAKLGEHYEKVLVPLVSASYHKMRMDHATWEQVKQISTFVERLQSGPVVVEKRKGGAAKKPDPEPLG